MEEMTKREKIINYLVNKLNYAYCDNCGTDDRYCDDCHRKYQNWSLSEATAADIVDEIIELMK